MYLVILVVAVNPPKPESKAPGPRLRRKSIEGSASGHKLDAARASSLLWWDGQRSARAPGMTLLPAFRLVADQATDGEDEV